MSLDMAELGAVREVVREEIRAALRDHGGAGEVLSYTQAAEMIGYHASMICRWVHDGLLPAHGRGKGRRVYRADVLRALERSGKPSVEPTAQEIADDILNNRKVRRIR